MVRKMIDLAKMADINNNQLVEFAFHFMAKAGGPAGLAELTHKIMKDTKSPMVQARILQLALESMKFIYRKESPQEDMAGISEADLNRQLAELMHNLTEEEPNAATKAQRREKGDDTQGDFGPVATGPESSARGGDGEGQRDSQPGPSQEIAGASGRESLAGDGRAETV